MTGHRDSADLWLAEHDPAASRARKPRKRSLIETRWDQDDRFIRVWLPGRTYRREHVTWLTPLEAESLARNLGKRLEEKPGLQP